MTVTTEEIFEGKKMEKELQPAFFDAKVTLKFV